MELSGVTTLAIGVPDKFVPHGSQEVLRKMLGLDAEGLYFRFRSFFARAAGARERRGAEGEGALDPRGPEHRGSRIAWNDRCDRNDWIGGSEGCRRCVSTSCWLSAACSPRARRRIAR